MGWNFSFIQSTNFTTWMYNFIYLVLCIYAWFITDKNKELFTLWKS